MKEENEELLEGVEEVELMEELTEDEEKDIEGGASQNSWINSVRTFRLPVAPAGNAPCTIRFTLNSRKDN